MDDDDQIMLVTDGGQVIRCPVHDIRIAGRNTQGVIIFKLGDGEKVASVAHLPESGPNEAGEGAAEDGDTSGGAGDRPE